MKKIFLSFFFVLLVVFCNASTRTIADGGGNFNAIGTWVEGAVPVAGDAVVATGTSGQLTVNVASGGIGLLSVNFTNYTNTLTMSNTLTVSGNVTLVAGMTITGTSDLIINATGTLTSNGKTFSGGIQFNTGTITFADNWTVTGGLTTTATTTLNGTNLTFGGNFNDNAATLGTISLIWNGSGSSTWSGNHNMNQNFEVAGTGTFIISGTVAISGSKTLKFTSAASVVTTGSTMGSNNNNPTYTINMAGITFNNLTASSNIIFNGTNGCSFAGTFTTTTAGVNHTFQTGNTYTFNSTSTVTWTATSGTPVVIKSSDAVTKAILTCVAGATLNLSFVSGTRIDSSGGQTVMDNRGTLISTINWTRTPLTGVAIFFR